MMTNFFRDNPDNEITHENMVTQLKHKKPVDIIEYLKIKK